MFLKTAMAMVVCCVTAGAQATMTVSFFNSFAPVGVNGLAENPKVNGSAVISYSSDTDLSTAQLSVRHLLPETWYGVLIEGSQSGEDNPLAFITDSHGRG